MSTPAGPLPRQLFPGCYHGSLLHNLTEWVPALLLCSVARKMGAAVFCTHEDILDVRPKMIMMFIASVMLVDQRLIQEREERTAGIAEVRLWLSGCLVCARPVFGIILQQINCVLCVLLRLCAGYWRG